MKGGTGSRKGCSGAIGATWAHSWAQTPAARRNHTGSDAKGPGVFLRNDGQMQPDAARRRRVVRTPKPGVAGSSQVLPGLFCKRSLSSSVPKGDTIRTPAMIPRARSVTRRRPQFRKTHSPACLTSSGSNTNPPLSTRQMVCVFLMSPTIRSWLHELPRDWAPRTTVECGDEWQLSGVRRVQTTSRNLANPPSTVHLSPMSEITARRGHGSPTRTQIPSACAARGVDPCPDRHPWPPPAVDR